MADPQAAATSNSPPSPPTPAEAAPAAAAPAPELVKQWDELVVAITKLGGTALRNPDRSLRQIVVGETAAGD